MSTMPSSMSSSSMSSAHKFIIAITLYILSLFFQLTLPPLATKLAQ
jgi:hypothetical protein